MSLCMHIRVEVGGWMNMHLILSASHIPTFKLPFIHLPRVTDEWQAGRVRLGGRIAEMSRRIGCLDCHLFSLSFVLSSWETRSWFAGIRGRTDDNPSSVVCGCPRLVAMSTPQ